MPFSTLARCIGLLVLAAALASCATRTGRARAAGAAAAHAAATSDSLAQTSWNLVRWTDRGGAERELPDAADGGPIQLTFLARDRIYSVAGYAGCNPYTGTYKLENKKLEITAPASTRMACRHPDLAAIEKAYLSALSRITTFTLDVAGAPRRMAFNISDGDVLVFARGEDPPSKP